MPVLRETPNSTGVRPAVTTNMIIVVTDAYVRGKSLPGGVEVGF